MKRILSIAAAFLAILPAAAQLNTPDYVQNPHHYLCPNIIEIPDIPGYVTLKADLHTHTVFSDGALWPVERVNEAWLDGLDVIFITDHIEVTPNRDKGLVKGDHNTSFTLHGDYIKGHDITVLKGAEITRQKPFGHMNALFTTDNNALAVDDPVEAVRIARRQGAVIMWNHPGWPDNKSTLYPIHEEMIKEGLIDLVEVHNSFETYPLVFDWVNRFNFGPTANSDVHTAISMYFGEQLRPITLIFSRDKSPESIKEALIEGRTAAFFYGKVMATEKWAEELLKACLEYKVVEQTKDFTIIEFYNHTDIPIQISDSEHRYAYLKPRGKARLRSNITVEHYTFTNFFVGMDKNLEMDIRWRK